MEKEENAFEDLWKSYPGQTVSKQKCKDKYLNLIKANPELIEKIKVAIKNQITWRTNAPTRIFIPEWKHLLTWLNGGCWDDGVPKYHTQPQLSPKKGQKKMVLSVEQYEKVNRYIDHLKAENGELRKWYQENVLKLIKEEISERNFTGWIKPLSLVSVKDNTLTLFVPEKLKASWITEHFSYVFEEVFKELKVAEPDKKRKEKLPDKVVITSEIPEGYDA